MSGLVTIFGGSGFVGRYVAQAMAQAGWRVRVAVRRPNEALFVRTYGVVGQVEPVQANLRHEASCAAAIDGADAVINCVGIGNQIGAQRYDAVHVAGAARLARLAAAAGAKTFVHVSAIGGDATSASGYARTKAEGEAAVLEAFPTAAILRPSAIFGPEDQFFNKLARLAQLSPVVPLVGAATRLQPVHVTDVAAAAMACATDAARTGVFELGGPDIETMDQLIARTLRVIRRNRLVARLPFWVARIDASLLDFAQFASLGLFTNSILTRDQVELLRHDNVVAEGARGLSDLGITPKAMEGELERYLYPYRPSGQYTAIQESASNLRP